MRRPFPLALLLSFCVSIAGLAQDGFSFRENVAAKKVEVLYNNKLLTAYCYFDSTEKPVLFPIKTLSGVTVTRGWPIAPREGERTDHPHHVGLWFNYESVNGLDFWNNSSAIPADKKSQYGSIRHKRVVEKRIVGDQARLVTLSNWVNSTGEVLIEETTTFDFSVSGGTFIIDRKASLKAVAERVVFKDVKDGALGIRVARSLELPSMQKDNFVDSHGKVTEVAQMNNEGVTGNYVNRENVQGDSTWGKRSDWTMLQGTKDGQPITIAIIDHPRNIGYPTYWHARGYGLFAANPFGQKIFSKGAHELNFELAKDKPVTIRYRVLVHGGTTLDATSIDSFMKSFQQKF
ncbi:MAG TPA: PmoA family protein [Chryseosolibacter sp.]